MGYTYWYEKKDYENAEKCFEEELRSNPFNVNAMCDLTAMYDEMGESRNSLKYARQALAVDCSTKDYLLNDVRLSDDLKSKIKEI